MRQQSAHVQSQQRRAQDATSGQIKHQSNNSKNVKMVSAHCLENDLLKSFYISPANWSW